MRSPPHICLQLVSFTKVSPTWCKRCASTVPGQHRQSDSGCHGAPKCPQTSRITPRSFHAARLGPCSSRFVRREGLTLPFVLAAPHPVVTQDQLSLSSSSSSGTQTGEMLEAGDNQTTVTARTSNLVTITDPEGWIPKLLLNLAGTLRRSSDRSDFGGKLPSSGRLKTLSTGMVCEEKRRS